MDMGKKLLFILLSISLAGAFGTACSKKAAEEKKIPEVGTVKMNVHPSTLEGKTVVLRWNGKFNGDHLLTSVADLLGKQVKDVKVIKLWEVEKTTAAISDSLEKSDRVGEEILKLKPDLVIGSQAD